MWSVPEQASERAEKNEDGADGESDADVVKNLQVFRPRRGRDAALNLDAGDGRTDGDAESHAQVPHGGQDAAADAQVRARHAAHDRAVVRRLEQPGADPDERQHAQDDRQRALLRDGSRADAVQEHRHARQPGRHDASPAAARPRVPMRSESDPLIGARSITPSGTAAMIQPAFAVL